MTPANDSVLLVGGFLSGVIGSRGVCEDLADRLAAVGWRVARTSSQRMPLVRLADVMATIWRERRNFKVAQIDLFSGRASLWAVVAGDMLRQLRCPYVVTLHGGNLPQFARARRRWIGRLVRGAAAVTAPSPYLARDLAWLRPGIRVVPNPIDLDRFPARKRDVVEPHMVWLRAFHSVYDPVLAVRVLREVLRNAPQARLEMIGPDKRDGSLEATRAEVARQGLCSRVTISGPVPKDRVPERLASRDIFLNTARVDNAPVTVTEAMACGCCVVSTDVGGVRDLVEDGRTALLAPGGDAPGLAQAVLRFLFEPGLAERVSAAARAAAARSDWNVVLPEWELILRSAIEGRR